MVQIPKINTNMYGALHFVHMDKVEYPRSICKQIDKTKFVKLINLSLYGHYFGRVNMPMFLLKRGSIEPCVNVTFDNVKAEFGDLCIRPGKKVMKLLKERLI